MTVRVALAGCGAWGQNLLRVLVESPRAQVVAVADPLGAALGTARALCPGARLVASLDDALGAGVDAVLIATPSPTHAALALQALEAGADVFVEKPLAMGVADAERCVARAAALGRVGMVGHLLRYHPAVVRLLELAHGGELGPLRRVEAERLSLSGDGTASALWTLGPHDLSLLHALDPTPIRTLSVRAFPDGGRGGAAGDHALLDLRLESGLAARIALSRAHGSKERRLRVVGARRVALFDDVRGPDRILVTEAGGAGRSGEANGGGAAGGAGEGVRAIRVPWREPLAIELEHFLRCVEERTEPLTPLAEGALVVRALARAEAAGQPHAEAAAPSP